MVKTVEETSEKKGVVNGMATEGMAGTGVGTGFNTVPAADGGDMVIPGRKKTKNKMMMFLIVMAAAAVGVMGAVYRRMKKEN